MQSLLFEVGRRLTDCARSAESIRSSRARAIRVTRQYNGLRTSAFESALLFKPANRRHSRHKKSVKSQMAMTSDESVGSVTNWLRQLQNGRASDAQQALWERYFQRLADIARTKLPPAARRAVDEEDIALSTLDSFFQAAEKARYPDLRDRTELWPLLARIAICKAVNQTEREFAVKRGGGKVRGDSALAEQATSDGYLGFDSFMATDPTPDCVVELNELVADMMEKLQDDPLRDVARLRLSGHSNREIAEQLEVSERTVERKLLRIRAFWAMLHDET